MQRDRPLCDQALTGPSGGKLEAAGFINARSGIARAPLFLNIHGFGSAFRKRSLAWREAGKGCLEFIGFDILGSDPGVLMP